jgi:hypothetical protein
VSPQGPADNQTAMVKLSQADTMSREHRLSAASLVALRFREIYPRLQPELEQAKFDLLGFVLWPGFRRDWRFYGLPSKSLGSEALVVIRKRLLCNFVFRYCLFGVDLTKRLTRVARSAAVIGLGGSYTPCVCSFRHLRVSWSTRRRREIHRPYRRLRVMLIAKASGALKLPLAEGPRNARATHLDLLKRHMLYDIPLLCMRNTRKLLTQPLRFPDVFWFQIAVSSEEGVAASVRASSQSISVLRAELR